MKKLVLIIFGLMVFASCSKSDNHNCATVSPPEPAVSILIVDSEGNSLLGEDNVYKPSEIKLNRGSQEIPLMFYDQDGTTFMSLWYHDMESEKDYFLKLNEEETDVINLKINTYNTECFQGLRGLEKFLVNGKEIQSDSHAFVIEK